MNDILHYTGHRTKLEERRVFQEINPDDNRRPDITVYNPSNTVAARLLLDISITSPLTGYTGGNFPVGSAAKARFNEKMNNYGAAAAQQGFSFLPIIFESTGFVHPETQRYIRQLAVLGSDQRGISADNLYAYFLKRLMASLQDGIANSLIERTAKVNSQCSAMACDPSYSISAILDA